MEKIRTSTKIIIALNLVFAIFFGIFLGLGISFTVNTIRSEQFTEFSPALPTKVLDINGELVTEFASDEKREMIAFNDIPQHMIDALISREDKVFYQHSGFSVKAIFRGVIGVAFRKSLGGGSTLTQQIAGTLYCDRAEKSISRKLKEFLVKYKDVISQTADVQGISLNDTYWIKRVDSKKTWKSVSPYSNPLNRSIADYSFMSDRRINGKLITHSPDFATSGQFPKCWKRINNTIYLIKGGSVGHAGAGNEPYSDIHAYMLANQLQIKNVPYEYIRYKNIDATKCKNICTEEIGIYPLSEVLPQIGRASCRERV